MIRMKKYLFIAALGITALSAKAQNSQVLYYMNIPQRHLLNPALKPSNSVYIGLPALSGINVNVNNNLFNFSDVFHKSASGDSVISIFHPDYNVADFVKRIRNINSLEPDVMVQLFGLGFKAGRDMYLFLDINERVMGNIAMPGDLLRLGFEGNQQFVGDRIDLSSLRGDIKYFREVGLGFSKNFSRNLRVGVKTKMLFGLAAVSIDNNSLGITVNENYTHTLDADLNVNFSFPLNIYLSGQNKLDSIAIDDSRFDDTGEIIDFLTGTKNFGLGLDIGAEYSITDRLRVSASVNDLGYIKWKKDISTLKAESTFEFSGIDLLEVYNGTMTFDSLGKELLDSLKNSFYLSETNSSFKTFLPVGITLGGSYNLTKSISVGILSYTRFIGAQLREALTLSANVNLGNSFSTTFAYTAANHRYDNLGVGLAFRGGWFQFYILADRIPVTWNKVKISGDNIPVPVSWNTVHLRMGLNLCFGNRIKTRNDKPMVLVQ
jgi:hypothetical protein